MRGLGVCENFGTPSPVEEREGELLRVRGRARSSRVIQSIDLSTATDDVTDSNP